MATDERLVAAYRAAAYIVESSEDQAEFVIRCEERSAAVDRLLERHRLNDWAFLTACNPRSQILPAAENAVRMERLHAAIRDLGHPCLPGAGKDTGGQWPAEPSLLILGMAEADAIRLAVEFGQHAVLVGRYGAPARLAWTPAKPPWGHG